MSVILAAQSLPTQKVVDLLRRAAQPALLSGILLGGIVILAAVVRVVDISDNPPGFFTDEASFGYNAYTILKSGEDEYGESFPILFRSFGEYKLPIYIYSQVPFIAALGLTELAVRLTSATYGTLTVLATFLLATALFRHRGAGLAAAFFLAIIPWHIHYSRTGLGDIITFPLFLTLGVYLFLQGVRRNELWLPAALVLGLTLYTYRGAWPVVPPLVALLAILYHRELLAGWRLALPSLAIMVLVGIPLLLHLLSDSGDRTQQTWIFNLDKGTGETIQTFRDFYSSYFSRSFLFDEGDTGAITRHYLPGFGQLYYIQAPFLLLGFLGLLWPPRREKIIVLALLGLFPLGGALSDTSPISSRTILGSVVFSLISGYGLFLAASGLARLRRPFGYAAMGVFLAAVLAIAFNNFASYLDRYHGEYPEISAGYWGWQAGPKEIIEYFVSVEQSYDQFIMDGEFNAPHMFLQFYAPNGCEKCVIGNTDRYDPNKRQLFALKPKNLPPEFNYSTREVIRYPGGAEAFQIVEIAGAKAALMTPDPSWGEDGRVLQGVERPQGIAVGDDGSLYLVDSDGEVRVFDAEGQPLRDWDTGLSQPSDIALDAQGNVYVVAGDNRLRRFRPDGSLDQEFSRGYGTPRGIDVAPDGTIYTANASSSTISVQDATGEAAHALEPSPAPNGDHFLQPTDVAWTPEGFLFAVTAQIPSIWKITPEGAYALHWPFPPNVTTGGPHLAWGGGLLWATDPEKAEVMAYDMNGGLQALARLPGNRPTGIAVGEGVVWVADSRGGRIFRFVTENDTTPQP